MRSLFTAILAAVGASLCCIGPLLLLTLGIGGAWMSYLTALEPYRPLFIGIALLFWGLAFRKLYLRPQQCPVGEDCAVPDTQIKQQIIFWVVTILVIAVVSFPYYGMILFE